MFVMRAPFPFIATTTLMPSPVWSDSKNLTSIVTIMRAMDGTPYTYVTSKSGRRLYQWTFELSRHKALELREFFDAYFSQKIKVTDHNGDIIIGYIKNNPFDFAGAGRAGPTWPGEETMSITIELEEV